MLSDHSILGMSLDVTLVSSAPPTWKCTRLELVRASIDSRDGEKRMLIMDVVNGVEFGSWTLREDNAAKGDEKCRQYILEHVLSGRGVVSCGGLRITLKLDFNSTKIDRIREAPSSFSSHLRWKKM